MSVVSFGWFNVYYNYNHPLFLPHVEGMLDDGKISNKQESRCGIVFFCVCVSLIMYAIVKDL